MYFLNKFVNLIVHLNILQLSSHTQLCPYHLFRISKGTYVQCH